MAERRDDWADRHLVVEFVNEDPPKGKKQRTRKFTKINGDASEDQVLQFSKAVSLLTPNGDGAILTDMYDHFMFDPE